MLTPIVRTDRGSAGEEGGEVHISTEDHLPDHLRFTREDRRLQPFSQLPNLIRVPHGALALKAVCTLLGLGFAAGLAVAQDQQLGARTKAMGGSYTAFEDDPVSVWLNPAGISTQPDQGSIAYQTYTGYPRHESGASGSVSPVFSVHAKSSMTDPAFIPSYLGLVFQLGSADVPMAVGLCYARPFDLNYSFDLVNDPLQKTFSPTSNTQESFSRFRVAYALDLRLSGLGEAGFFTHLSAGAGVDVGFVKWQFTSPTQSESDSETSIGGGAGALLALYDNYDSLRINLGVAYQSGIHWNFSDNPALAPAFQMPEQLNAGMTFYLFPGTPLRLTLDVQWIQWSKSADRPFFPDEPGFHNAVNYSVGAEYRITLSDHLSLYPRVGYRRFDAPWANQNDLPMTSNYKLVLDTKAHVFNIATMGVGLGWTTQLGKVRSLDLGADVGGDAPNFALGFNMEF